MNFHNEKNGFEALLFQQNQHLQALDTVEFEKLAVRKLKMSAKAAMATAEKLYSQGWISYPRLGFSLKMLETSFSPKILGTF